MTLASFPDADLYVVEKYAKVTQEGPPEHFFDQDNNAEEADGPDGDGDAAVPPENAVLLPVIFESFQGDDPYIL